MLEIRDSEIPPRVGFECSLPLWVIIRKILCKLILIL